MEAVDENERRPAGGRGHWVVMTIVGIGLVAASFAWAWNFNRGRRTLEFWGPAAARLIRTGRQVDFLRPAGEEHVDLSRAPGLLNARASLLSDASFVWDAPAPALGSPLFTVRFSEGERAVNITFDFENRVLHTSSTGKTIVLAKKTAEGWQSYLARHAEITPPGPAHTAP